MDIWFHPARELDAVVRAAATRTLGFDSEFAPGWSQSLLETGCL